MAEMMEHAQEIENNENAVLNMSGAFEIEKLTVRFHGGFSTWRRLLKFAQFQVRGNEAGARFDLGARPHTP